MASWFKRYWPWLVALLWLIGYELFAVFSPAPTLSQIVWAAPDYLLWVVLPIVAVLILHFWFGLWK